MAKLVMFLGSCMKDIARNLSEIWVVWPRQAKRRVNYRSEALCQGVDVFLS
jgi:hypothetical protein